MASIGASPASLLAAKAKLRKAETKVTPHPTVDELGEIKAANPALLKFYEQVIVTAESERRALKKEVQLKVGHRVQQRDNVRAAKIWLAMKSILTSRAIPPHPASPQAYDWQLYINGDASELAHVRTVTFDLHPTFKPSSVEVSKAPFAIQRRGWGSFPVRITILDSQGASHALSYSLDLSAGGERNVTITILKNGLAREPKRMKGVSEVIMHGRLGVGKKWRAPFLVTECSDEARPGYKSMRADEFMEDPKT